MRVAAVVATLGLALACAQPSARPYVGEWHRALPAGGDAVLTIKPTGVIEIRTPGAPNGGVMKGPAMFHLDTATFSGASCERGEARYQFTLSTAALTITPLGADGCTRRRETLGGAWTRR
jgi:hypothetical protein